MLAISIRQPWAWAIAIGAKDVENRTWWTGKRGKILIHASAAKFPNYQFFDVVDLAARIAPERVPSAVIKSDMQTGGIVAVVEIKDCVREYFSLWANNDPGTWKFVLANVRRVKFIPMKGQLGFFETNINESELEYL